MINVTKDKDFGALVKNLIELVNQQGKFSYTTYRRHLGDLSLDSSRVAANQVTKHRLYYQTLIVTYYQSKNASRVDDTLWIENTSLQSAKEALMFAFFSESF